MSVIRLHPSDDVAVARRDLTAGETLDGLTVREDVRRGHKVATRDVAAGAVRAAAASGARFVYDPNFRPRLTDATTAA
ncbi:MAG TPA: SAF domain-containing protein, partial [Jatrophihabitantaceae bacterium]|nr:SAF domain-containing protein [Jatrophihabitantaceae bacterium]